MNQFQEDPLKSAIHIMDHLILCQERRMNSTFENANIFKKHCQRILLGNSKVGVGIRAGNEHC